MRHCTVAACFRYKLIRTPLRAAEELVAAGQHARGGQTRHPVAPCRQGKGPPLLRERKLICAAVTVYGPDDTCEERVEDGRLRLRRLAFFITRPVRGKEEGFEPRHACQWPGIQRHLGARGRPGSRPGVQRDLGARGRVTWSLFGCALNAARPARNFRQNARLAARDGPLL